MKSIWDDPDITKSMDDETKERLKKTEEFYGKIVLLDNGKIGRVKPRSERDKKRDAYMERVKAKENA